MNAAGFTSAFASELDGYLAFKEAMGFYGSSRIWYLRQFDAYCTAHGRTVFDRETVEGWVTERLARSGRYRSWMSELPLESWRGSLGGDQGALHARTARCLVHSPT